MKRVIIFLLVVCLLVSLVSCNQSENNVNNNNSDNINNNQIEQVTVSEPDCRTGGKHIYIKGVCKGCGIKVFDIIRDFVIENHLEGTYFNYRIGNYKDYICTWIKYSNNSIEFSMSYWYGEYNVSIFLDKYSIEDGHYQWDGYNSYTRLSISGYIDAGEFHPGTHRLDHTSSHLDADSDAEKYAETIKKIFEYHISPFLEELGYDITLADLGFTRFE